MSRAKRKTITIPAPLARPGDIVQVRNYRLKPAQWESGEVHSISFIPARTHSRIDGTTFRTPHRWRYDVAIYRPITVGRYGRNRGGGYVIGVGDDGIEASK